MGFSDSYVAYMRHGNQCACAHAAREKAAISLLSKARRTSEQDRLQRALCRTLDGAGIPSRLVGFFRALTCAHRESFTGNLMPKLSDRQQNTIRTKLTFQCLARE
jgi:hypothetical protein